jgi:primosomal protein N' (replication factor Y)
VRWDPAGFAYREMTERQSAHLPPASRLATVTGSAEDVEAALSSLRLPEGAEALGPVPLPAGPDFRGAGDTEGAEQVRAVLRVPRATGPALSRTLVEMNGVRSAKKLPTLRVQVDPVNLE